MKCIICGKEIEESKYTNATLCSKECFTTNFWEEKVRLADEYTPVVNGTRYHMTLSKKKENGWNMMGHGGSMFYIKFNDGRTFKCNNLWCQGDVPEAFKDRIPDNAVFVTPEEGKDYPIY